MVRKLMVVLPILLLLSVFTGLFAWGNLSHSAKADGIPDILHISSESSLTPQKTVWKTLRTITSTEVETTVKLHINSQWRLHYTCNTSGALDTLIHVNGELINLENLNILCPTQGTTQVYTGGLVNLNIKATIGTKIDIQVLDEA